MIQITKNRSEVLVIQPGLYLGTPLLHCQVCKPNKSGGLSRTGKGLSLRSDTWREVVNAVTNVLEEMAKEGEPNHDYLDEYD